MLLSAQKDSLSPTITMNEDLPILYVKTGCPYCIDAVKFLANNGVGHRQIDVLKDRAAFAEMRQKSGQDKAPVLDWHGEILADFGVEELAPFLLQHGAKLEDS